MSRRHSADKREIMPDPKFGNVVVTKFMNSIMHAGKKSVAKTWMAGTSPAMTRRETKRRDDVPPSLCRQTRDHAGPEIRERRGHQVHEPDNARRQEVRS